MPSEAKENIILDALLAAANLIVGAPTYNTNPTVKAIGVPDDVLPQGNGEQIYLQHTSTDLLRDPTGPSWDYTARFHAWIVGDTDREVLNVVDDMRRAARASYSAITAAGKATHGFSIGSTFIPDADTVKRIGKSVRILEFVGQFQNTG